MGIFLYASRALDLLPTNVVTEYGIVWGAASEAILLSVALAARMRIMKKWQEFAKSPLALDTIG